VIISLNGKSPRIHPTAFVAPTAVLIGDVEIGADASIWFGAVLRGDHAPIRVGARTNLQENVVVHVDEGRGCTIGEGCTIGHGAVLHTAQIADHVIVGTSASVLEAVVGEFCVIAPGAVVIDATTVPPGSLVVGTPGVVKKPVSAEWRARILSAAEGYVRHGRGMREAVANAGVVAPKR